MGLMVFKVGQKVRCLAERWEVTNCIVPIKGHVYTIRGISQYPRGNFGFVFEEITNIVDDFTDGSHELHFSFRDFAPLAYSFGINYDIMEEFKPVDETSDVSHEKITCNKNSKKKK